MDFEEIVNAASAQAMADHLEPDAASSWRKFCRDYSKKFHTPLPEVLKLNVEDVVLNVIEDNLDEIAEKNDEGLTENILDLIYSMIDPEYASEKESEINEFISDSIEQEQRRIKDGKPIHRAMRKDSRPVKLSPELPKAGNIDLSYLEDEDNER